MDRLTAIKVFISVVEQGSLSAAADDLSMSRAMVSRYLAELEAWVGGRLLHRTTRSQSLTPSGEAILLYARKLSVMSEEITNVLSLEDGIPRGLIRVTCSQSLLDAFIITQVCSYLKQYPHTSIELIRQDALLNLVTERIDLALRITNQLEPHLIARRLGTCHSVVCASPQYLKHIKIPEHISELALHNCLVHDSFSKNQWRFTREQVSFSVVAQGNFNANCATILWEAARQHAGIAMLPRYLVQADLTNGSLVEILPEYTPETLSIYAIFSSHKHMPVTLRTFLDFLVSAFRKDLRFS